MGFKKCFQNSSKIAWNNFCWVFNYMSPSGSSLLAISSIPESRHFETGWPPLTLALCHPIWEDKIQASRNVAGLSTTSTFCKKFWEILVHVLLSSPSSFRTTRFLERFLTWKPNFSKFPNSLFLTPYLQLPS